MLWIKQLKMTDEISSMITNPDGSFTRIVFNKRKFNDDNINKYSVEDFKKAMKELNINFCEPKISILEKEDGAFEILKKASKVKFDKEDKTELEEYILNRLRIIIDYYKPFESFDIKSCP